MICADCLVQDLYLVHTLQSFPLCFPFKLCPVFADSGQQWKISRSKVIKLVVCCPMEYK